MADLLVEAADLVNGNALAGGIDCPGDDDAGGAGLGCYLR